MRAIRGTLVALLCLPLTACFEEPVREHLHVAIRSDGSVVATVVQQVAPSSDYDNPQLAERLEESRQALAEDLDPWSQRFDRLQPLAEHTSVERLEGEVRRSIHSAVFASFGAFLPLVEADGLTGDLIIAGNSAVLELYPSGGTRATYLQRKDAERRLHEWSAALAEYFDAVIALYRYLDHQPDRAVPCLAHVFDSHEGLGENGPLTPAEESLVLRAKETMELVADALLVPEDASYSLNELSRLVYDPFPARLTVAVDGDLTGVEGFVSAAGFLERLSIDVWNALRSLEGRWLDPDLVTAAAAPLPEDQQPEPDVLLLASMPRRYTRPPTSDEIEGAILAELVPEEMLRLRWRPDATPNDESDASSQDWLAVMAAAEASVPP
jgi:hypothetical protein